MQPWPKDGWSPGYTASRDGLWAPCCCLSGKGYDTSAAGLRLSWLVPRDPGAFQRAPEYQRSGVPQFHSSRLSPQGAEEAGQAGWEEEVEEDGKERKGLFRTLGDYSTSRHASLYNLAARLGKAITSQSNCEHQRKKTSRSKLLYTSG